MEIAAVKKEIAFEELQKIDVRVGTILSVEGVPESRKLVSFRVDFGDHQRTILAGMKQEREDLAEVVGQQALFVVNLPPQEYR